ncbi:MAG: hypothetical protein ACTS6G_05245 [Candidatus Hodgkinia cicadicola]
MSSPRHRRLPISKGSADGTNRRRGLSRRNGFRKLWKRPPLQCAVN